MADPEIAASKRDELSLELLGIPYDALTPVQRSVIDLVASEAPTVDPNVNIDDRTPGERLSDQVASAGGSWGFIIGFAVALSLWMAWNAWGKHLGLAFDPYPFIFLNLLLSTLAALQAPIIMMSQNRAAARDREAAEHDYVVNLRAELEIMHLHDKVDHLRAKEIFELLKRQNEAIRLLKAQVAQLSGKA